MAEGSASAREPLLLEEEEVELSPEPSSSRMFTTSLTPLPGDASSQSSWLGFSVAAACRAFCFVAALAALSVLAGVLLDKKRGHKASGGGDNPFHEQFLTVPDNTSASMHLKELTSEPHLAGTPANHRTALYVKSKFEQYGLDAHLTSYDVLGTYPLKRSLTAVYPHHFNAILKEAAYNEDPQTADPRVVDTFAGYSPSGDVISKVVYANYGRVEDFAKLKTLNVSVKGLIVLVRYGKIFRANKVDNAAHAGAAAVLLYSDPLDYAPHGTDAEHVYPRQRWLPPSGVQRGTCYKGSGDPFTPGWPSTLGCERLELPLPNLPTIPVLPISYGDAQPLLEVLGGTEAPQDWQGGVVVKSGYRLGPGILAMDNKLAAIHNVIAHIPGREEPNKFVIIGNHRDAWVYGASDPNSGTATMLEVARGFGQLLKSGWQPRRTILLCSWDGEEQGLLGSVEWAEDNEAVLSSNAVVYLNVDMAVAGDAVRVASSPTLDHLLYSVAAQIKDPATNGTLWQAATAGNASSLPVLERVGDDGSDHSAFIHHLGIPVFDAGFDVPADEQFPVYHSVYDDYHWMATFGDPGFHKHVAMAQLWGMSALRFADDHILPLNFTNYAFVLAEQTSKLHDMLRTSSGFSTVSLSPITLALSELHEAAEAASREQAELRLLLAAPQQRDAQHAQRMACLNQRLLLAERGFLDFDGLAGRPWFRHLVYAPAQFNSYGSSEFPGITDAVTESATTGDWKPVQHEVHRVARVIVRASRILSGRVT
eukprot:jgi/Chlat1/8367/Chrsp80S09218